MNNKIRPISLRLNLTNLHIYKTLTNSNKNNNYLNFLFIENYLKSLFSFFYLSKKTMKTEKKYYSNKKTTSGTNTTIFIGNVSFKKNYDGLYIKINYYLDKNFAKQETLLFIKKKLKEAQFFLQKTLKHNIYIIKNNLHNVFKLIPLINNKMLLKSNLQRLKIILLKNPMEKKKLYKDLQYSNKINKEYLYFKKSLMFYQKNEYFNRLHKVFFILFLYKRIDVKLLVNAIAIELSKLRKGHSFFFKFLNNMLTLLINNQKTNHKIKGLSLTIKGRLILRNRQTPRKKKFILNIGKLNRMTLNSYIIQENCVSIGRLGSVNINLLINFSKIKRINYNMDSSELVNKHININNKLLLTNTKIIHKSDYIKNFFLNRVYLEKQINSYNNLYTKLIFFIEYNRKDLNNNFSEKNLIKTFQQAYKKSELKSLKKIYSE